MRWKTVSVWDAARPIMRQRYFTPSMGWQQGFTSEEVDFYSAQDNELVEIAIGTNPDDWRVARFGAGLSIWTRILPAGAAFTDHDANIMNVGMMRDFPLTVLGHMTGGTGQEQRGSILSAYLPLDVWAEYANMGPDKMAIAVGNFAAACATVSRTFRRQFGSR